MKIYYRVEDGDLYSTVIADHAKLSSEWYLGLIGEWCAGDYYDNHNGLTEDWPMFFEIYNEEKRFLCKVLVNVKYEPTCVAGKVVYEKA